MQSIVIGCVQQSGIGKESGKPYALAPRVQMLSKFGPVQSDRITLRGAGFEVGSVECTEQVFQEIASKPYSTFPVVCDLETELHRKGDQMLPVVVAVKFPAK